VIFKDGVYVRGVSAELVLGLSALDSAHRELTGEAVTVTSVSDGRHGNKSLHYSGRGADVRTRHLSAEERQAFFAKASDYLPEDFDLVAESDHFHLEFDPRGRLP